MARIVKNPLGELSGKAGELVFKNGKNGAYISSRPGPTRKKPSAVQQLQRNKMKLVMDFLIPIQGFIKECYFPFQKATSGFHAAKSYYLKHALLFEDKSYRINYPKALISFGDLRPAEGVSLEVFPESHSFKINWSDNSHQAMAFPNDRLLLSCYAPETNRLFYKTNLADRKDASYTFQLDNSWEGMKVHLWTGFHQPENQRASASVYVGEFEF